MNGRVWPLTVTFLAGILIFVGPAWVSVLLIGWTVYKTRQLVGWWLLIVLVGGALIGYHEHQLQQSPPLPQGQILVMPTSWTITGTFVRYSGTATNGIVTSGSANVSQGVADQLSELTQPVIVTVKKTPERLTGARNEYEFDYANYTWWILNICKFLVFMGTVPLLSYNECRGISCFWQFPLHLSSRNGGFIHGLSAY